MGPEPPKNKIPRVFGSFCNFFCNWAGIVGWLKITKFLLRHGSSLPGVRNTVVIIMKKRKVKKI